MEKQPITYTVTPTVTDILVSVTPFESERVEAWSVARVQSGMAWHIGRYDNEQTAKIVAGFLGQLADKEA